MSAWRSATVALFACVVYRALVASLVVLPWARGVAEVVGAHPQGDAVLWQRGGVWLLETSRQLAPSAISASGVSGLTLLLCAFGWLLPLGALIASLGPQPLQGRQLARIAVARSGTLSLLFGTGLALQLLTIWLVVVLASAAHRASVTPLTVVLVAATIASVSSWLLGLCQDAARVCCVNARLAAWGALRQGWRLLRASLGASLWAAAWRTVAGLAVLLASVALTGWLLPKQPWTAQLLQLCALTVWVLLRASWLRWLSVRHTYDCGLAT